MLLSPRKNGLDSLFEEVRVVKVRNTHPSKTATWHALADDINSTNTNDGESKDDPDEEEREFSPKFF